MAYWKVIQSGDLVEVFRYEKEPAIVGKPFVRKERLRRGRLVWSAETDVSRRSDNLVRTRLAFQRRVRSNLQKGSPALLTLTMLAIVDVRDAFGCLTAFGCRIRKRFGSSLSWVAVPEFQKRGAVHFHVLIWGLPDSIIENELAARRIANQWRYGFVDLVKTDGDPRLAGYLSKYMSKAMHDGRLRGQKAFVASRNCLRSVSLSAPSAVDTYLEQLGLMGGDNLLHRDFSYPTLWLGRCDYKSYVIPIKNEFGSNS